MTRPLTVDELLAREGVPSLEALFRRAAPRGRRWPARRTPYGGRVYASGAEARRAFELDVLRQAGLVRSIEPQPAFPLEVVTPAGERVRIGVYTADFRITWSDGRTTIEDVKGTPPSRDYVLRKKHAEAQYGITIEEVGWDRKRSRSRRGRKAR